MKNREPFINPVKQASVQDLVYEALLQAILSGRIHPGEKITIEGAAKLLQVSLMPVRVALQKLGAGGFVTIAKNRRITANELTTDDLKEITELRLLVECYAAEKACLSRSRASVKELEKLCRECVEAPDSDEYIKANRKFHGWIYHQAGRPLMEEVINGLWQRVSPYLHILLRNEEQWRSGTFARNHEGMVKAFRDQDPQRIREWLTKDLSVASDRIQGMLHGARKEPRASARGLF
jgi:DNA-binding GntR family transcriptional regulator